MRIQWTEQALRGWNEVANYIAEDFGRQGLKLFKKRTKECEEQVVNHPNSGTIEWDDSNETTLYRSILVYRKSKMLYFVLDGTIFIADFWDVRTRP